ncbi:MAG TPA: MFS transporter, partial [Gammaproteobacteria bacterium]|nr:MFS transporter [Gammaproteobacteria bacterium]
INMQTTSSSVMNDIKEVFRCKEAMLVCILGGLMIGPLEGFSDVWGKEFLQHAYGFDSTVAASLPSVIFIAMCFGAPILSYIAVKTKDDVLTIFGAGLLMAISFILLLFADLNASVISLVFSIIGVCCGYQTIVIYKASTYVREGLLGLTTAVANMIMMLFGYAFHSIIGLVVSLCQDRTPAEAFTYGIAAVPAALCIGAVGFLFIYWREGQGELAVNNLPSH